MVDWRKDYEALYVKPATKQKFDQKKILSRESADQLLNTLMDGETNVRNNDTEQNKGSELKPESQSYRSQSGDKKSDDGAFLLE